MITLLPDDFVLPIPSQGELNLASIAWGFSLGFGLLTAGTALKQTFQINGRSRSRRKRVGSIYLWMIWSEIAVCLAFSIICWLYLALVIPPSFAFYFCIVTLWALQVQFLLQIIINRVSILLINRRHSKQLKYSVAALITLINISVYCIWIPARLQISQTYIDINRVWDRIEKCIYLVIDALLNGLFIYIVQKRLVSQGLTKYRSLVTFNKIMILFSLSMDVLIIAMMSLPNTFVYMQFHPLAYIVKLKIEMSMADLIARVAQEQNDHSGERGESSSQSRSVSAAVRSQATRVGKDGKDVKWYAAGKAFTEVSDQPDGVELEYCKTKNLHIETTQEITITSKPRDVSDPTMVTTRETRSESSSLTERKPDLVYEDTQPLTDFEDSYTNAHQEGMRSAMGTYSTAWAADRQ